MNYKKVITCSIFFLIINYNEEFVYPSKTNIKITNHQGIFETKKAIFIAFLLTIRN